MLAITVELLLGTYRADPDGLAHTGQLQRGEWPPAPLRLLAALVAGDGTRDRCRHTTGEELAFLEAAPPPVIYASGLGEAHHQPLLGRFVVTQANGAVKGKSHQEYQGRAGAEVRPGVRVSPRFPVVTFVWDVEPADEILAGLQARAARIGYLGTSDSPVAVTVGRVPPADPSGVAFEPDEDGELTIGVPRPGVVAAMDAHYDRWVEQGPSVHRSQSPGLRRLARYRNPGAEVLADELQPTVLWLGLDRPISGRRISAVTGAFKAAVLDHHQRAVGEPPPVLHGHVAFSPEGYSLAWFLAMPDVGHANARGHIHGLALVLPVGTSETVVAGCRTALYNLTELHGPGFARGVRIWSGEPRPIAANPARWVGRKATRFATAFPALHERRGVELTVEEVGRWCQHAGLPVPVAVRSSRGPLVAGGVDLVPAEVNRPGRPPHPYSHLELEFAEPVDGLVVIGAGRQRGFGLCVPLNGSPLR